MRRGNRLASFGLAWTELEDNSAKRDGLLKLSANNDSTFLWPRRIHFYLLGDQDSLAPFTTTSSPLALAFDSFAAAPKSLVGWW